MIMRREISNIYIQRPLYLEEVRGYKTVVDGVAFFYYKDKKEYKILLGMNGAILSSAKTVKEVEERISSIAQEINKQILTGEINIDDEIQKAESKPLYRDWLALCRDIENEIGIDIQFAVRGDEVSYTHLIQYLRDNPDFNDIMNAGEDVNSAIKECFGEDVYNKICRFVGMERIVNNEF